METNLCLKKELKQIIEKRFVKMYLETGGDPRISDCHGRTLLHYAVKADGETVAELIKAGADVNARDSRGRTPLHWAVATGKNIDVLLYHGADPNVQDVLGNTPLHYAIMRGDEHAARLLLAYFADPRIRNRKCVSPIDMARKRRLYGLAKLMEEVVRRRKQVAHISCAPGKRTQLHEAIEMRNLRAVYNALLPLININVCDEVGRTPLHYATMICGDKSVEIVKMLLEHWPRPRPNVKDIYGRTPLHYASMFGEPAVVEMLLEHYADPTAKDNSGKTPLDYAREYSNDRVIPLLERWTRIWQLATSRDPVDPDAMCYRARCGDLFRASRFGYLLCTQNLLDAGADPNMRNKIHETPLHYAAKEGHVETVRLLLNRGADPNAQDFLGYTPLHYAALNGHVEVAKLLLERADPNLRTTSGETPLHFATKYCTTLQLLLSHGADPNARDEHGRTPLHWAAIRGTKCSVEQLLRHGADPNAQDADGNAPLHEAGNEKVALILAEHVADVNMKNNKGQAPLHMVAKWGYISTIELLLNRGADVNAADSEGNTPLHYATMECEADAVKLLLERGADPAAKNAKGETPIDVAKKQYEKYRGSCDPFSRCIWRDEVYNCAATLRILEGAKNPT